VFERVDDEADARMLPVFARTWTRVLREHRAGLDRFRVDSARNRELRGRLHSVLRSLTTHNRVAVSLSVAQLLETLWGRRSLGESPAELSGGDARLAESKAVAVAKESVADGAVEEEAPAPRRRRGRPKKGKAVVVPSSSPSSSLPLPNESTRVVAKSLTPTSGPGASPNAERRKNAESESECRRRARFLSVPHSDTS
jgi:hypothetical protein